MAAYFDEVKAQLKDGKAAFLVIIFTLARLITNIAGEKVTNFDPLYINKAFAWIAQNVFLSIPGVTDTLVVILEILVGVFMILGFRIFWTALIAMFMNLQFLAGGSFNNFGYIWTNLAMFKFARYAELLGVDGFLRSKQNR